MRELSPHSLLRDAGRSQDAGEPRDSPCETRKRDTAYDMRVCEAKIVRLQPHSAREPRSNKRHTGHRAPRQRLCMAWTRRKHRQEVEPLVGTSGSQAIQINVTVVVVKGTSPVYLHLGCGRHPLCASNLLEHLLQLRVRKLLAQLPTLRHHHHHLL